MTHDVKDKTARKSIGQPLTYRDAARSHVHGLDDFESWIAQAERGLSNGAITTTQQTDNLRYAIETLDALRPRVEALLHTVTHKDQQKARP
ncbi:MAG: hypothetical protein JWN71_2923 [Xanthobacteraceae bacterium]|nr:hypothetical protein [Xanthobacteraceae bacterium]